MAAPGPLYRRYLPLRAFRGEVGVVYLCSDLDSHSPVALKTVELELAPGATAASFLEAARSWIRLGVHPHIVSARSIQEEDPLCVVVDFVEPAQGVQSPALRSWLRAPIVPEAACAIALGIARGMSFAAGKVEGLVHGDLRPENVLIGRDLRARVTNFGLGVHASRRPSHIRYWAPERWSGSVLQTTDIYAFGLILLEMVTGSIAVPDKDPALIEQAHRGGMPRDQAVGCGCPVDLLSLIVSCLDPSETLRPRDWATVESRLADLWPRISGHAAPIVPDEVTAAREEILMRAWSSQAIAHALRERGAEEAALVAYRGVARIAAREGDPTLEASALTYVALMLRGLGELEAATRELWHALELRRELRDGLGQAEVMCMLGDAYACRGDTDNALGVLFAAARLFAEEGDRRGVAACRRQMAPVLDAVGRGTEARDAEAESAMILADLAEEG
jgi:hypothetical protein